MREEEGRASPVSAGGSAEKAAGRSCEVISGEYKETQRGRVHSGSGPPGNQRQVCACLSKLLLGSLIDWRRREVGKASNCKLCVDGKEAVGRGVADCQAQ